MTFVLAIVKSILATQRNDFGFNKCELKSLNNVGYCGKKNFLESKKTHVGKMRKVWKNDFVIGLFLLEVVYFPREVRKDFEMYFRKHPW